MTINPARADSITPSFPRITFSTSGVSVTHTNTKSAALAASLGELAHLAPWAINSSAFDFVRELTIKEFPPLSKCPAMGAPMIPVPMNATFAAILFMKSSGLMPGGEKHNENEIQQYRNPQPHRDILHKIRPRPQRMLGGRQIHRLPRRPFHVRQNIQLDIPPRVYRRLTIGHRLQILQHVLGRAVALLAALGHRDFDNLADPRRQRLIEMIRGNQRLLEVLVHHRAWRIRLKRRPPR